MTRVPVAFFFRLKRMVATLGLFLGMCLTANDLQSEDSLSVNGKTIRYRGSEQDRHMLAEFEFESKGYRNIYLLDCRSKRFLWVENIRISTGERTGNTAGAAWKPLNPKSTISNSVHAAFCRRGLDVAETGKTPSLVSLFGSCQHDSAYCTLERVEKLIEEGADPNESGGPLRLAIAYGLSIDILQALIEAGADVNATHTAVRGHGRPQKIAQLRLLLEAGADPNARDEQGLTPLMYVALDGLDAETAKELLNAGADPAVEVPANAAILRVLRLVPGATVSDIARQKLRQIEDYQKQNPPETDGLHVAQQKSVEDAAQVLQVLQERTTESNAPAVVATSPPQTARGNDSPGSAQGSIAISPEDQSPQGERVTGRGSEPIASTSVIVDALIRDGQLDRDCAQQEATKEDLIRIRAVDLNNDDKPEYLVEGNLSCACGAQKCFHWVYRQDDDALTLLMDGVMADRIAVVGGTSNGYKDLKSTYFYRGNTAYTPLRFDGSSYVPHSSDKTIVEEEQTTATASVAVLKPTTPSRAVGEEQAKATADRIEIKDGSTLSGTISSGKVPFESSFGEIQVNMDDVRSFSEGKLSLADGTVLKGKFHDGKIEVATSIGTLKVPASDIVAIKLGGSPAIHVNKSRTVSGPKRSEIESYLERRIDDILDVKEIRYETYMHPTGSAGRVSVKGTLVFNAPWYEKGWWTFFEDLEKALSGKHYRSLDKKYTEVAGRCFQIKYPVGSEMPFTANFSFRRIVDGWEFSGSPDYGKDTQGTSRRKENSIIVGTSEYKAALQRFVDEFK